MKKPVWNYSNIFWISLVHLLALGAFFFPAWENTVILFIGIFVLAPLGINVGYHRLLTHKGFTAPNWLRYSLATIGSLVGGGPPIHWAAMHRAHHRYSDTAKDPHDSRRGFWYSHVFHLFLMEDLEANKDYTAIYTPDLIKEPYLVFLEKYGIALATAMLPLLYLAGGWAWVFWGGFLRTACIWHIMWLVNSASHMWGYRNYETKDNTVNCWWVGLLAAGEGWHNNHHAQPSVAKHGHRWWELDLSYMIIRSFELAGIISEVKRPSPPSANFGERRELPRPSGG
ncbi:MAG TPA: fatty acid desaturase [Bdellovibrionota bacterium]|jgi:stearoyl-CoA desaturase (delta-9 desaturase)